MNSRERFLAAVRGEKLDRPPVWLMRQAGRYLPEYRELKQKHSFLELAHTPELAAEVTLQPLRRFPLDAAIIFSDILVVPEAMGQAYSFRDQGGIEMSFCLREENDFKRLQPEGAVKKLEYVAQALRLVRRTMGDETALLGFCGSPWTLAAYMVEGGKPGHLVQIKNLFYRDRALFERLLLSVTEVCCDYVKLLVEAGADAIQIFDSWGGMCPAGIYQEASLKWIGKFVQAVQGRIPVILYAKGMGHHTEALTATGAKVLSLDWTVDLPALRKRLPATTAVQGNLDPALLLGDAKSAAVTVEQLLQSMSGSSGYIFNVGHGLLPGTPLENVGLLVDTVVSWKEKKQR